MLKLKVLIAALVSVLPSNALRVIGYRLLGYRVRGRIGFGTVIGVADAQIAGARIGAFNWIVGPMRVIIGENAVVGNRNIFTCGLWTIQEQFHSANYGRSLYLGAKTLVTTGHYFDVAGSFILGDGSWVAGTASQFWTHGARAEDRDICIGRDCYIGSAVRFAPGSAVGHNVIVAMGSVVARKFDLNDVMLGGVPAVVLKQDYHWRNRSKASN